MGTETDRLVDSDPISPRGIPRIPEWLGLLTAILLAAWTVAIIDRMVGDQWQTSAEFARGVVDGTPPWHAFQNRLLAPYVSLWISKFGVSYLTAAIVYTFATIGLAILTFYLLARRACGQATEAVLWTLVYCFSFTFLQAYILMVWDATDMWLMTILAYLMTFSQRIRYLVPLYFLATLNRESGLYVALFVVIDSFDLSRWSSFRVRIADRAKLAAGVAMLVIGVAYTKLSRDLLFDQLRPGATGPQDDLLGNHRHFANNIRDLFKHNWMDENILHTAPVVGIGIFLLWNIFRLTQVQLKIVIFSAAIFLAVMVFGILNETRVLFPFVPIFVFFFISWGQTNSRQEG